MVSFPNVPPIEPDVQPIETIQKPWTPVANAVLVSAIDSLFNGEKFLGGLGPASVQPNIDFQFLRGYSWKLFYENTYARGLLKRLITNEIGPGQRLEASPIGPLVDMTDEQGREWSNNTEQEFMVWGSDAKSVDWTHQMTFGELQAHIRLQSMLGGDVLIVLRYPAPLNLPVIELIDAARVQSPFADIKEGVQIHHGVEVDKNGRHIAYHVRDTSKGFSDQSVRRITAFGEKSKRRLAWLVYSGDRRIGQTRGVPLLAAMLQSLKEIDRYRDAEQRAALVNAFYALSIERERADVIPSNSITGGAVRRDTVSGVDSEGNTTKVNFSNNLPGLEVQSLTAGEKLVSHSTARPNVNFGGFEEAITSAMAWSEEIPPEILRMSFSSNYSASRAAVNEFNAYLKRRQALNKNNFLQPIYAEWLVSMVLLDRIEAPGFLAARRSTRTRNIVLAWGWADWPGPIKPSVDLLKDVKAYKLAVDEGFVSRERSAADLFGTKIDVVLVRLKKENETLAEVNEPLNPVVEAVDLDNLVDDINSETEK